MRSKLPTYRGDDPISLKYVQNEFSEADWPQYPDSGRVSLGMDRVISMRHIELRSTHCCNGVRYDEV